MSGAAHKFRYKNVGLDSTELRRRREEEGVQLRKQKREQQLFKRRNVTIPPRNAIAESGPPKVKILIESIFLFYLCSW